MSSGSKYSIPLLHGIFDARQDIFIQLYDEFFAAHQTRLVQRLDQASVLEQRNLKRVLAICKTFVATSKRIKELDSLFDAYDVAQPYFQPQLRNQISASFLPIFDWIEIMISSLKSDVEKLESTNIVATGTE